MADRSCIGSRGFLVALGPLKALRRELLDPTNRAAARDHGAPQDCRAGPISSTTCRGRRRHSFGKTIGFLRQAQPRVHRLLPHRKARRGKPGVGKRADGDPVIFRGAVALPVDVAAAVRTEMKADLEPAIGHARVDLVVALDPHLGLPPAAARMDDRAGAALASLAVADINPLRLARSDRLERAAMAFRHSFHADRPEGILAIFPLPAQSVEPLDMTLGAQMAMVLTN